MVIQDIGVQRLDGFDGLFAVDGFSANFPLWPGVLQHATHALTNYFMVVDNQTSSAQRRVAAKVEAFSLIPLRLLENQAERAVLGVMPSRVNRGIVVSIAVSINGICHIDGNFRVSAFFNNKALTLERLREVLSYFAKRIPEPRKSEMKVTSC
jgi:hypothetical protein